MINLKHLFKVSMAWVTIAYIVCFLGVWLFPSLQENFMKYALHTDMTIGQNYITVTSFITGLVVWNILALVGVWFFVMLFNRVKG